MNNKEEVRMNTKEKKRVIGRHKARLLTNLEDAGCPVVFIREVKSAFDWLRTDLTEGNEGNYEQRESEPGKSYNR